MASLANDAFGSLIPVQMYVPALAVFWLKTKLIKATQAPNLTELCDGWVQIDLKHSFEKKICYF
jgi:hypothetical protein